MKKHVQFYLILSVLGLALLAVNCSGGSGSSTPAPTPNPTANTNTTSGGVGVISVSGKTIAFVPISAPTGSQGIGLSPVVVENTGAAAPALAAKAISLGAPGVTTSFGIDSCSVDATALKVVCVGYGSPKVAIFDITNYISTLDYTKITETETDLTTTSRTVPSIGFSGGTCINCGVATDPGDNRFVVSSGDGYTVLDYTGAVKAFYNLPPVENFSFEPGKDWILAPEYDSGTSFMSANLYGPVTSNATTTTITTSLQFRIVDINAGKVYTWDKTVGCSLAPPTDTSCYWSETDSVSIDPTTGIAVLAEEGSHTLVMVDLSQATFSGTSFSAPFTVTEMASVTDYRFPGTAVEPLTHIMFMEDELGAQGIAVFQLPAAGGSGGAFPAPSAWSYNSVDIPANNVCGTSYSWANPGDPHGLAIFTSQINGKPTGLLVSSAKDCVALVDLKGFLVAPKLSGQNAVDTSQGTAFITFVKP